MIELHKSAAGVVSFHIFEFALSFLELLSSNVLDQAIFFGLLACIYTYIKKVLSFLEKD